jgi:hypothetical protein
MRFGYYSRCVLVEVRESAMEAMDVAVKYGFERLEVKVIDVRAPVVRKLGGLIVTISPLQKGCMNL